MLFLFCCCSTSLPFPVVTYTNNAEILIQSYLTHYDDMEEIILFLFLDFESFHFNLIHTLWITEVFQQTAGDCEGLLEIFENI
jgi:hypothetical protein